MYYDSIYKKNPKFCGQKPNKLLIKVVQKLSPGAEALDLGCGQGRDSFYMTRKKFNITAVDNSKVAISQIKEVANQKGIKNIETICENIAKFEIKPKKFSLINCHNALQFLDKKSALKLIGNIKKNILPNGFIILTSFTEKNPPSKRRRCHFKLGEMKKLFSDPHLRIIHYFEGEVRDSGHIGQPEPHKHGVVEIIARKRN